MTLTSTTRGLTQSKEALVSVTFEERSAAKIDCCPCMTRLAPPPSMVRSSASSMSIAMDLYR